MLPLLLPWIVIVLVIASIILSFWKKWRIGALLIVLAIAVNWWSECIPFRLWPISEKAGPRSVRVLTFNIRGTKVDFGLKSEKLANIIGKKSPDVIYISELGFHNKPLFDSLLAKDYTYTLFGISHGFYSKYPLLERMTSWKEWKEIVVKGDVINCLSVLGEDTIALWGCHLASNDIGFVSA